MASTSLVILDLKEIDPERHRRLTGKDNANILAMARHVSDLGVPLWIRHVLVPGLTDDEDGLRRTADFIRSLNTVQRVEVLPYHTLPRLTPIDLTHTDPFPAVCRERAFFMRCGRPIANFL